MKSTKSMTKAAIFLVMAAIFVTPFFVRIPFRGEHVWMCANTGSTKTVISFPLQIQERYEISAIEAYATKRQLRIRHEWVKIKGTRHFLYGGREYVHQRAPWIYHLSPEDQKLLIESEFAAERLRSLVAGELDTSQLMGKENAINVFLMECNPAGGSRE